MKVKKDLIFHYTSIDNFFKILEYKEPKQMCFYATHAKFFSDPYEYDYVISLMVKSMQLYEQENSISPPKKITKKDYQRMNVVPGQPYIISFSKNEDDLTMWRTYGKNGEGIAIGLDKNLLYNLKNDDIESIYPSLHSCLYDEKEMINDLKNKYWKKYYNLIEKKQDGLTIYRFPFFLYLVQFGFRAKRKEYHSEKEYRLCKSVQQENKKFPVLYQVKNGIAMPFIKIALPLYLIKKIWIGPSVNTAINRTAIDLFLKSKGLGSIIIKESKKPFRNI